MNDDTFISGEKPAPKPTRAWKKSPHLVLVVDDDSDVRQLSVDVLTASGYGVEACNDGDAGWQALQTRSYDLVITDNKMPKMTGLEMIEKLRSASMALPVIMATTFLPTSVFVRKPWLEPDAVLQRPCSNEDLLEAVKKVLRKDDNLKSRT